MVLSMISRVIAAVSCLVLLANLLASPAFSQSGAQSAEGSTPPQTVYSGGDGSSCDNPVVINLTDWRKGVAAEYQYLEQKFPGGKRGRQALAKGPEGRKFDRIEWVKADGSSVWVCFDINRFFGNL